MKKAGVLVIISFLAMGVLSLRSAFAAEAAAAAGGKYAFVDVAKVFDEYQKTKDNDQVLQAAGKKKEMERDNLVHEIRQMKDELVLLRDDAKAKKQEQLDGKVRTLQEFDEGARQALGEQRNAIVREIFKDIDNVVQRYGQRKGFDMVFNERALIYHSSQLDISKDVTDELNKDYAAKKKG